MKFSIYRYNPDTDKKPYYQAFEIDDSEIDPGMMLLDVLLILKEQDPSLSFRRSCGEGICGSDGLNVNGTNRLACTTKASSLGSKIEINPLPGLPVIRDLIVDMEPFMRQYRAVKPWLTHTDPEPEIEFSQTPKEREQLDGLYECILCACCSTSCPSFWWNPDKFLGPAALLQAWRFITDSRDQITEQRLKDLDGPFKLFRCHTIMNCVQVCPKGLNPTRAINNIKDKMLEKSA